MQIRKFCLCGCKLERQASDEDTARKIVMAWWLEHTGIGHGPASERAYKQAVSQIIAKSARPKRLKKGEPMPDVTDAEIRDALDAIVADTAKEERCGN